MKSHLFLLQLDKSNKRAKTVHLNPSWKDDFKKNYKVLVEEKCSNVTRDAIDQNEDIQVSLSFVLADPIKFCFQDMLKRRKVRNEVINAVVEFLVEIHEGVGNPSKFLAHINLPYYIYCNLLCRGCRSQGDGCQDGTQLPTHVPRLWKRG